MRETEQSLRDKLNSAKHQIQDQDPGLLPKIVRLSILEEDGDIIVGYNSGSEDKFVIAQRLGNFLKLAGTGFNHPLDKTHDKLEVAAESVELGGTYRHYKSPEMTYSAVGFSVFEEDGDILVGYEAQYGEKLPFERRFRSFTDNVRTDSGVRPRFSLVET